MIPYLGILGENIKIPEDKKDTVKTNLKQMPKDTITIKSINSVTTKLDENFAILTPLHPYNFNLEEMMFFQNNIEEQLHISRAQVGIGKLYELKEKLQKTIKPVEGEKESIFDKIIKGKEKNPNIDEIKEKIQIIANIKRETTFNYYTYGYDSIKEKYFDILVLIRLHIKGETMPENDSINRIKDIILKKLMR